MKRPRKDRTRLATDSGGAGEPPTVNADDGNDAPKGRGGKLSRSAPLLPWPNFIEDDEPSLPWLGLDANKFRGELAREFPALHRHLRLMPCTAWDMLRIARALCIAMGIAPPGNDPVAVGAALEAAGIKLIVNGKSERQDQRTQDERANRQKTRDPSRGGRSTEIRARASHLVQAEALRLQNEANSLDKKLPVAKRFRFAVQNVVNNLSAYPGNALNKRMLEAIGRTENERREFMASERVKFIATGKSKPYPDRVPDPDLLDLVRKAVAPTSSSKQRQK